VTKSANVVQPIQELRDWGSAVVVLALFLAGVFNGTPSTVDGFLH
jgi:hypothetical protein